MAEMVKLIVSVPRELKERLDAVARGEDRPVASVVRRMLAAGLGPTMDEARVEAQRRVAAMTRQAEVVDRIKGGTGSVPVGGQDAAAGKGVEERVESREPDPALLTAAKAALKPLDAVVIGGEGCTHPHRYQLGRRCEAPGCGKVVR